MTTLLNYTVRSHKEARDVHVVGRPSLKMSAAVKKRNVVAEWKTYL